MPTPINSETDIEPGEIYEDTSYHPCLCLGVREDTVWGVSLVDGSYPRSASIRMSAPRKLTLEEAWRWKLHGPADEELGLQFRWWEQGHCPPTPFRDWTVGRE